MEISNLPFKEVKVMVLQMITELNSIEEWISTVRSPQ